MRRLIAFALVAGVIAAINAAGAAGQPPGTNGKIVTNSDNRVTGEEQVYSVDPDGSDRQLVMNNAETGQWSPDLSVDHGEGPGASLEADDERDSLLRRMERLDSRERSILALRYGLEGEDPMTLKEIGERIGLTRERVRQIEHEALNKLRDANISILLAHQTFTDLEKVSKEYSRGIWDNTRNKIVLYQNDPDVCERLAKALGTKKGVELTVRRSVDSFLNSTSMLEASSRLVDAYRLHPNRIKALRCGQAYLAQDAAFHGVNLEQVPELPTATLPAPKPASAAGLGLHELFLAGTPHQARG